MFEKESMRETFHCEPDFHLGVKFHVKRTKITITELVQPALKRYSALFYVDLGFKGQNLHLKRPTGYLYLIALYY